MLLEEWMRGWIIGGGRDDLWRFRRGGGAGGGWWRTGGGAGGGRWRSGGSAGLCGIKLFNLLVNELNIMGYL